jgi:hypothetical protein
VFLRRRKKALRVESVCLSVRDLLHSTKQYSSYFTDLSVQCELGNFRLAEGWVRASACTVRICVPICVKFCVVPNIHAVWLGHFEFCENLRSESRFSLTCISGHIHNSVLSEIRFARFAPTALWVCENLRSQGRTFVVAVNEVTSSDTCVLWNRVTSLERLGKLTECVVGSAPVRATCSNLNCVYSLPCARTPHWPTYHPLYKHLLLNV